MSRAEFEAVLARLQKVEDAVQTRRRLHPHDVIILSRVLPAVAGCWGSEWFLVRDLMSTNVPALRLVLRDLKPAALGLLLATAASHPVDGYVVERGGLEHGARLWRVVRVIASGGL